MDVLADVLADALDTFNKFGYLRLYMFGSYLCSHMRYENIMWWCTEGSDQWSACPDTVHEPLWVRRKCPLIPPQIFPYDVPCKGALF